MFAKDLRAQGFSLEVIFYWVVFRLSAANVSIFLCATICHVSHCQHMQE